MVRRCFSLIPSTAYYHRLHHLHRHAEVNASGPCVKDVDLFLNPFRFLNRRSLPLPGHLLIL